MNPKITLLVTFHRKLELYEDRSHYADEFLYKLLLPLKSDVELCSDTGHVYPSNATKCPSHLQHVPSRGISKSKEQCRNESIKNY
jgi:hypothetical protein